MEQDWKIANAGANATLRQAPSHRPPRLAPVGKVLYVYSIGI